MGITCYSCYGIFGWNKRENSLYPKIRHECPKCHQKTAVKLRRRNNDYHRTFYYVMRCLNPDCRYDEETEKKKANFQFGCVFIFAVILFYAIVIK